MNISIHTMYFLPDFGSAPILMNELASYLSSRRHAVEVITTIPRKRGKEFRGKLFSVRRSNGFIVKRYWTNATVHPYGRLIAWNIYTLWATAHMLTCLKKGDVLFLRVPPLQLGVMGYLAKKLKKAKVVLNVQDIHPDLSIESGILTNPFVIRLAQRFEKWVYKHADVIPVISEGFKKNLTSKGVDPAKLPVIPNWVDTDFLQPHPKDNAVSRQYGLADKFVVMYSGTISISSNLALERILQAAGLLQADDDIRFVIVGDGIKKPGLEALARNLGLANVLFLPFQPYADLPHLLASSDMLLVPLDKEKSQISVPSKLYNFMAAGRTIFGLAEPSSEVAKIISEAKCGVSVPPDDVRKFAETVVGLKSSPAACKFYADNARKFAEKNFAKNMILETYEKLVLR